MAPGTDPLPVLVLRPEPGATRTATRLAGLGFRPLLYPLFEASAVEWQVPDPASYDGLLMTSANAARLAGDGLRDFHTLPLFAVGRATARAAQAAGFRNVRVGGGDAAATVPMIADAGHHRVLHPGGAVVRPYDDAGLAIDRVPVYRTRPAGDAAGLALIGRGHDGLSALVHSPRAGERLAALVEAALRARISVVAISAAAARACGSGWQNVVAARTPDEDAMLMLLQNRP